jgi:hypothetical protein
MEMNTVEILEKARELIIDESRWTREAYMRSADGERADEDQMDVAVCFCGVGAIAKAKGQNPMDAAESYEADLLAQAIGGREGIDFFDFNDTHTHAEVIAAFDLAIASAKAGA